MKTINDISMMSDDELEASLGSVAQILSLAAPWLIDSGHIVVDRTLSDDKSDGRLMSLVKSALDDYLLGKESMMAIAICKRFEYCAKKKKHKRRLELVKSVGDALCMFLTGIPVPMVLIAAYVIEDGYCDRLCSCSEAV